MPEDVLLDEEVDEGLEPLPPEEGVEDIAAEEEVPVAQSLITLTPDDIPELVDYQIGDQITFQIADITDDNKYSMSIAPTPVEPAAEEEVVAEAPVPPVGPAPAGGREAVLGELTV